MLGKGYVKRARREIRRRFSLFLFACRNCLTPPVALPYRQRQVLPETIAPRASAYGGALLIAAPLCHRQQP